MNYLEAKEELNIKNKELEQDLQKLNQEKENKIREATKKITEEYASLITEKENESQDLTTKIEQINLLFYKYSLFDNERLGLIISALMSIFESEEYQYEVKEIKVTRTIFDSWGSNYETINEEVALVYKKGFNIALIKSEKDLIKYDCLVLGQKYYIDDLRFYNKKGQFFLANINPKYAYVKDFINYLIMQKINQKTLNISFDDMKEFLKKYLLLHQEEIELNYQKRMDVKMVNTLKAKKNYSLTKILSNL